MNGTQPTGPWREKAIPELVIRDYLKDGDVSDLGDAALALLRQQKEAWPRLGEAMAQFDKRLTRTLQPGAVPVTLQHNPGRMVNVSAKVDAASIEQRPCFLCVQNLPQEQLGILWEDRYALLANPAPIFEQHLTIVHFQHRPQRIADSFGDFLELTRALSSHFTLYYNGPRCGASAPDHLHFQAGCKSASPLESQLDRVEWLREGQSRRSGSVLRQSGGIIAPSFGFARRYFVDLGLWTDGDRSAVVLLTDDSGLMRKAFADIWRRFTSPLDEDGEAMLNLMACYVPQCWIVFVFLRKAHRPACYHAEGEHRYTISPGAVDMAGLVVAPDPDDYRRLDDDKLSDIFREVSWDTDELRAQLSVL